VNRRRRPAPFEEGDLAYISTKNISFPKGYARKLVPKYIGPYKILKNFGNSTFRMDIPSRLKQRGVHDAFHASLLRIHIPNDDRLFPGRLETQIADFGETEGEWAVDHIVAHSGTRSNALFQIKWKSGDLTWLPYDKIDHLDALRDYFKAIGIADITELTDGGRVKVPDPNLNENFGLAIGDALTVSLIKFGLDESGSKTREKDINGPLELTSSQNLSPMSTPAPSPRPLAWLQRVKHNKILIRSPRGYTRFMDVTDVRNCLNFDTLLRKPGADLLKLDIPVTYIFFADKVNSDPLVQGKLAHFDLETGIIYTNSLPVNRDIFTPFVRSGNSQPDIFRGLGLSSREQQALCSRLLLQNASRGMITLPGKKKHTQKRHDSLKEGPPVSFSSLSGCVSFAGIPHIHMPDIHAGSTTPASGSSFIQNAGSAPGQLPSADELHLNAMIASLQPDAKANSAIDEFGFLDPDTQAKGSRGPDTAAGNSDASMSMNTDA